MFEFARESPAKRLTEYYASEGATHPVHITIPIGQYIPAFKTIADLQPSTKLPTVPHARAPDGSAWRPSPQQIWVLGGVVVLVVLIAAAFVARERSKAKPVIRSSYTQQAAAEPPVGLPVGEELRILAGLAGSMSTTQASYGVRIRIFPAAAQC